MSKKSGLRVTTLDRVDPRLMERLVEMEKAAFGQGGMNEWFMPAFVKHGMVFVLWRGDYPVGVAECMRDWRQPREAYLFGLSLDSSARGKGWGRLFLTRICASLAKSGFLWVSLTVSPNNTAGLRLYRSLKFQTVSFLPNEYGHREHRLFMKKHLKDRKEK